MEIVFGIFMFITLACVFFAPEILHGIQDALENRRENKAIKSSKTGLSWPAAQIMQLYKALPESSRPYGNFDEMLKALDVKHGGVEDVNRHFTGVYYFDGCSWAHNYGECKKGSLCKDYVSLRSNIETIQESLKDQQRQLEISKVSHSLSELEDFKERLRNENELIRQTTKELVS